jgi:hypothetical protein
VKIREGKVDLKHFLLGSYTIGFVFGSLAFFLAEINIDFHFSFSFESIFCIAVVLPILYWVYRYSGLVFNDQTIKMKLLYFFILILGFSFGIFFFELLLG